MLLSRLSPKKSHELFFDLIVHLKKNNHNNKNTISASFCSFKFLSFSANDRYRNSRQNVLKDNFEFKIDQFKIPLTALALSDHSYYSKIIFFKFLRRNPAYSVIFVKSVTVMWNA